MARTPLAAFLRQQVALQRWASGQGKSADDVRETLQRAQDARHRGLLPPGGVSRRFFLGGAAAAGATLATAGLGRAARAAQPRIAILGGGGSGLNAALTLADAGYTSTVYEATTVGVGGRMQSDTGSASAYDGSGDCGVCHGVRSGKDAGTWDDGIVTDIYGELIDTDHTTIIALADRFGVPLVDMLAAEPAGSTETYHFLGSYYSKADADADFKALWTTLKKDLAAAGYPTTWDSSKPGGRALDDMSIYEWIESRVDGGHASPMGRLLDVAYVIEFGADSTDQSALSLLYLLGYGSRKSFSVFGASDERYRAPGGIAQIPRAMADSIGWGSIKLGYWLESIALASDGTYTLSFDVDGGGVEEVTADIVLCTLPFAVLRDLDTSGAGFDALKDTAIQELGRGKNGKLQLQFTERVWQNSGPWGVSTGSCYSDNGMQAVWDPTRGQSATSGILIKYTGGSPVDLLTQRHPYGNARDSRTVADAQTFLGELEGVFGGITAYWNGRVGGSMAHNDSRFNCSYSYWKVGQYQSIAGYEAEPQGNVFFAGEHTSVDFQGWMEGAARSGEDAASNIVSLVTRGRY